MNRMLLFGLIGLITAAPGIRADKIEVVAVQVMKAIVDEDNSAAPSTRIDIIVHCPNKCVVGISSIQVISFTDDKKTDLAKNQDFSKSIEFPTRFKNRSRIQFPVSTTLLPVAGAHNLRLKGSVRLKMATGESSIEQKGLIFSSDELQKLALFDLRFNNSYFDVNEKRAEIAYNGDILKSVCFLDKNGKLIDSSRTGSSAVGGPEVRYLDIYSLKRTAAQITVQLTYYNKFEFITVPFDFSVGLGLGADTPQTQHN
jgi:hypothetical protein